MATMGVAPAHFLLALACAVAPRAAHGAPLRRLAVLPRLRGGGETVDDVRLLAAAAAARRNATLANATIAAAPVVDAAANATAAAAVDPASAVESKGDVLRARVGRASPGGARERGSL